MVRCLLLVIYSLEHRVNVSKEAFRACPTGKWSRRQPKTRRRDCVSFLAWQRLRTELEEVSAWWEVWAVRSLGIRAQTANPVTGPRISWRSWAEQTAQVTYWMFAITRVGWPVSIKHCVLVMFLKDLKNHHKLVFSFLLLITESCLKVCYFHFNGVINGVWWPKQTWSEKKKQSCAGAL